MSGYTFKQDLARLYFPGYDKEVARRLFAREIHSNADLMADLPDRSKESAGKLLAHHSRPSHSPLLPFPAMPSRPPLRPLSGHSMPAILRNPSPCRPSASAPTSYPMPAPSAPPPSSVRRGFPATFAHPTHPAHKSH